MWRDMAGRASAPAAQESRSSAASVRAPAAASYRRRSGRSSPIRTMRKAPGGQRSRATIGLSRRAAARLPLIAAGMAAALFLAAFFGGRQAAVAAIPDLAGLYAAVGLPVNLDGLAIEDVEAERAPTFAGFKLKVRATIRNIGKSEADDSAARRRAPERRVRRPRAPTASIRRTAPLEPGEAVALHDGIRQRAASRRRRSSCASAGAGRRSPSLARPSATTP